MKVFVATVLIETEYDNSAYSELVSETYDKEAFEAWCKEEIETIMSEQSNGMEEDDEIITQEFGLNNFTARLERADDIMITIDIQEKEL